jgi:hypothetical protein
VACTCAAACAEVSHAACTLDPGTADVSSRPTDPQSPIHAPTNLMTASAYVDSRRTWAVTAGPCLAVSSSCSARSAAKQCGCCAHVGEGQTPLLGRAHFRRGALHTSRQLRRPLALDRCIQELQWAAASKNNCMGPLHPELLLRSAPSLAGGSAWGSGAHGGLAQHSTAYSTRATLHSSYLTQVVQGHDERRCGCLVAREQEGEHVVLNIFRAQAAWQGDKGGCMARRLLSSPRLRACIPALHLRWQPTSLPST